MSTDLPSFNKNYATLKEIAENLRSESEKEIPDIDNLLPMVEAATKAYRACKERLDAVEKALEEMTMDDAETENQANEVD